MLFPRFKSIAFMAFLGLFMVSCQTTPKVDRGDQTSRVRPPRLESFEQQKPQMDFGEDWESVEGLLTGGGQNSDQTRQKSDPQTGYTPPPAPRYGICLATFIDSDHELGAQEYIQRISMLFPGMTGDLSIHMDKDHSKVLYGDFEGWKDPRVGDVTRELRSLRVQGRQIFNRPILTEVIPPRDPRSIHPLELISVRENYPNVRVLYTIEVAVWGDFGGGVLKDNERRRLAHDYAQALRQDGHQAWFDHNERKKLSTVTVGIFDHTAIDSDSGIHSDAVERVLRQFPARLVNGELLMEPVSPGDPGAGTRVQKPRMVEVPKL